MANKHLRLNSKAMLRLGENNKWGSTDSAWWYEESGGITIVVQNTRPTQFRIPWGQVRAALERKDRCG